MRTSTRKKEWFDDDSFWRELYSYRMQRAGFVSVTLYGNLDGDKYGPNAERLIAIGRKPVSKHHKKRSAVASRNAQ